MPGATVAASPAAGFTRADLTTFCRLDELGLEVTGQRRTRPCRARVPGPRTRPVAKLSRRGLRWALEAVVVRHEQRADRGDQWTTRAPPRLGTRIPQPHQLHRQITGRVSGGFRPDYTLDCEEPVYLAGLGGVERDHQGVIREELLMYIGIGTVVVIVIIVLVVLALRR
jgi:hypothetical protein